MADKSWLFELRGPLKSRQWTILSILGLLFFLFVWFILTMGENPVVRKGILPGPLVVLKAYKDLYYENDLIQNTFRSIGLNLAGYVKALLTAIPIGFVIGLFPIFRGMFQRYVDAVRFIPLTAVTSLFILWFGIATNMKVNFLAFGILIYLLPIVVQRIDEVKDVYLKTVYTIGATDWQTIRTVYVPSVLSRLSDDIRVLTAISWTYIIVAENIASEGGLGPLIYRTGQRMGRVDKIFAGLILIVVIGAIQDRIFVYLDKEFFPHKYQTKRSYKTAIVLKPSLWQTTIGFSMKALIWTFLGLYFLLALNEYFNLLGDVKLLSYLFGDTIWVVHLIFICMIAYKSNKIYKQFQINKKRKMPANV